MQGLEKSFRSPQGMVHAVGGVDISIERGETVALLGPNGAGKSTTIDMLLGLTTPDAGSVSLFGHSPSRGDHGRRDRRDAPDRAAHPRSLGAGAARDDGDSAIRALLQAYPAVRDIEIAGAGLEQAFLLLTGGGDES